MAALTAFLTSTNDTLLAAGRQLTNSAPATESSVSETGIPKSTTGWVEMLSRGGTTAAPNVTEPTPTGSGFIWDVTTLEGQQIIAGNWTPTVKLSATKTLTATIVVRAWVRSSGGVFTQIGTDMSLAAQSIGSTATVYAIGAVSQPLTNFNTGDKLYVDLLINITTGWSGSGSETVSVFENGGANEQVVTPGYQVQPPTDPFPAGYYQQDPVSDNRFNTTLRMCKRAGRLWVPHRRVFALA